MSLNGSTAVLAVFLVVLGIFSLWRLLLLAPSIWLSASSVAENDLSFLLFGGEGRAGQFNALPTEQKHVDGSDALESSTDKHDKDEWQLHRIATSETPATSPLHENEATNGAQKGDGSLQYEKEDTANGISLERQYKTQATVDRMYLLLEKENNTTNSSSSAAVTMNDYFSNNNPTAAFDPGLFLPNVSVSQKHCALLFYGLPRAFETTVLPSIIRHILIPNVAGHQCHVFAYVHSKANEAKGRSGKGGDIDPKAIHLLETAVKRVKARNNRNPSNFSIRVTNFSDQEFESQRSDLLKTIDENQGLYVPAHVAGYNHETVINVARMWHGMQGVWNLMQQHAQAANISYARVGLFRADVFYTTPVEIFRFKNVWDYDNRVSIIPGFAKFPVNDRFYYGPFKALEIYATQRFALVHEHVRKVKGQKHSGMHSEKMLGKTIFPLIRDNYCSIQEDSSICFVRARADGSLWVNDCDKGNPKSSRKNRWEPWVLKQAEETLQAKCKRRVLHIPKVGDIKQGFCRSSATS